MRIRSISRLAAALLLTAACSGDSTGPRIQSGFHGAVTGAENRSLSGDAYGQSSTTSAGTQYVLALSEGDFATAEGAILFVRIGRSTTKGSYQVGDGSNEGDFVAIFESKTDQTDYYSTGGTVTITSISGSHVEGRFDMNAVTDPQETSNERTVRVTGSFSGNNDGIPGFGTLSRTATAPALLSRVRALR